jgi:hypothetical protein
LLFRISLSHSSTKICSTFGSEKQPIITEPTFFAHYKFEVLSEMLAWMHVLWDVEVWKCGRVVTDAADNLFVSIFRVYTVSSWTSQGATTRDFCVAIVRDCTEDRDRQ